jgi:hypothetical protein
MKIKKYLSDEIHKDELNFIENNDTIYLYATGSFAK